MNPYEEQPTAALREECIERDGYVCQDCVAQGTIGEHPGIEMEHIVSKANYLCLVIMLCPHHHRGQRVNAHTRSARRRHLQYLQDQHGYDYSRLPERERARVQDLLVECKARAGGI